MKLVLHYFLLFTILTVASCRQKSKKEIKEDPSSPSFVVPEKATGWVSDLEKVFSSTQKNHLDSIIAKHENETSNEIAIVTLKHDSSLITTDEDFKNYSRILFNKWGVGKKEKNNGIGFMLSISMKKITIQVGKGLETKLTDDEAKTIIDKIILPEFIKGGFYTGTLQGVEAIMKEIK